MPEDFTVADLIPVSIVSVLFIAQVLVGTYMLKDVSQNQVLAYSGVVLYIFSGLVFGWMPMAEFRKRGCVKDGESYIQTSKLVDTGIYSIVRHPQYMTFMMFAIAGSLLFQHYIVVLLGVPIIPLVYVDLIRADRDLLKNLGMNTGNI